VLGCVGTVSSVAAAGQGSLDESRLRGAVVTETGTMPAVRGREVSGRAEKHSC
jgi:hypothetical protein